MPDPGSNMSPGGGYFDWGAYQQNLINDQRYNAAMQSIVQQYGPQAGAPTALNDTLRNSLFQQTMPAQVAAQNLNPQNIQSEIALRNSQAALAAAQGQNVTASIPGTAAQSQVSGQEATSGMGIARTALTTAQAAQATAGAGLTGTQAQALQTGADRMSFQTVRNPDGSISYLPMRMTSGGQAIISSPQMASQASAAAPAPTTSAPPNISGIPPGFNPSAGVTGTPPAAAPAQVNPAAPTQVPAAQASPQIIPAAVGQAMMVPGANGEKLVSVDGQMEHAWEPTSVQYQKFQDQAAGIKQAIVGSTALQTRFGDFIGTPTQRGVIDTAIAALKNVPTSAAGIEVQKYTPTSPYNTYMAAAKQIESIAGLVDFGNMVTSGDKFGRLSNQVAKMSSEAYVNADPSQDRGQLISRLQSLKNNLVTWRNLSDSGIKTYQQQLQPIQRTLGISNAAFGVGAAPRAPAAAAVPAPSTGGSNGGRYAW